MNRHIEALEQVRQEGKHNMLMVVDVYNELMDLGYCDTVDYLTGRRGEILRDEYYDLLDELEKSRS